MREREDKIKHNQAVIQESEQQIIGILKTAKDKIKAKKAEQPKPQQAAQVQHVPQPVPPKVVQPPPIKALKTRMSDSLSQDT